MLKSLVPNPMVCPPYMALWEPRTQSCFVSAATRKKEPKGSSTHLSGSSVQQAMTRAPSSGGHQVGIGRLYPCAT